MTRKPPRDSFWTAILLVAALTAAVPATVWVAQAIGGPTYNNPVIGGRSGPLGPSDPRHAF